MHKVKDITFHYTNEQVADPTAIIYLQDIKSQRILPFSDYRLLHSFFTKHNIPVFGNKKKYIFLIALKRGLIEERISDLQSSYGKGWLSAFQSEMRLFSQYQSLLNSKELDEARNIAGNLRIEEKSLTQHRGFATLAQMNLKPLYIPKEKRQFGLKVSCRARSCDTWVYETCPLSGLPIERCKFGHLHSFKSVVNEPGNKKRRTKNYSERDLKFVLPKAAIFYEEVKNGKIKKEAHLEVPEAKQEKVETIIEPTSSLSVEFEQYLAFLRGSGEIPEHKRRKRDETYCKYVARTFHEFIACQELEKAGEIKAEEVSEEMIGKFHSYLLSKVGPVTYNMKIRTMRSFYTRLIKKGVVKVNPFYGVLRRAEPHNISVLSKEEFEALMKAYEYPEYGKRIVGKELKDYFRSWCPIAIKIMLMSGRRSEEALMMKWCDIQRNSVGEMNVISIIDYKVSRQQNRLQDNPKRISVPVTQELKEVLMNCGYEHLKNTEQFIIGNEELMERKTMKRFLSKSFSQFWSKTEYAQTKKATLKICRRTYLSSLAAEIGIANTSVVSQHSSGSKILQDYYVSSQVVGATAKNFSVFNTSKERQEELNRLRKTNPEITMER